ncbi:UDP-N-acetylmuramoyl-L-alanyl-D-glutamate synthetase [Paenibacillus swuensis]|uniref:UDP-N-acetylmuramoylalanine--D-glutamate ligase n=1 Tax=Paenibacillus swuensis TaxID=1178515 RepID=A0A172TJY3_9BACL|nr:UDP-N-acetylmuramoyl-L-alanine--D-glutamate ligase [Paenibacillus swuensis]ANE47369.1 UDP-N-acetylmuramoyl-L-alanyl-D-glutamate synthetase [Paenibacillus swuensis]
MKHPSHYARQHIIVLGMAKSGSAVAKVFHALGASVTVNDMKDRGLCPEADELSALGISVLCGGHPDDLVHEGVALVVKNPGIPYTAPPIVRALELGIEVVTEVEVAYHVCPAPMIGITGSNGKTTTTTWIGRMLDRAGLRPIVAGNIGRALTDAAIEADEDNWMVVELSSFQLKGTDAFRPRIACLLNLAETHLDYHGTMDDYIASKAKLFANQTAEDTAVLNWDDAVCRSLVPGLQARLLPFSARETLTRGVYLDPPLKPGEALGERRIVYAEGTGAVREILRTQDLGIPGTFNAENALAAAAVAIAAGAPLTAIAEELSAFRGVEHRLEFVAKVDGVTFYNNSKATNATATISAVESLDQPIVLIAGGLDRGSDYAELLPVFERRVKALVALGETRGKLLGVARQAGIRFTDSVDTGEDAAAILDAAVRRAAAFAEPGDIVLLSPACASWDMFASYEERGSIFKKSVHSL